MTCYMNFLIISLVSFYNYEIWSKLCYNIIELSFITSLLSGRSEGSKKF